MYGTKSLEVSDVLNIGVVAYFCHHLTDNYFDLSDLYVDLSLIMLTYQIIISDIKLTSIWQLVALTCYMITRY